MGFYQQGFYHGYGFDPQRETMAGEVLSVTADGKEIAFKQEKEKLVFANLHFTKELKIVYKK